MTSGVITLHWKGIHKTGNNGESGSITSTQVYVKVNLKKKVEATSLTYGVFD